jgi:hypothetical protein
VLRAKCGTVAGAPAAVSSPSADPALAARERLPDAEILAARGSAATSATPRSGAAGASSSAERFHVEKPGPAPLMM